MMNRKKLSDILNKTALNELDNAWDTTQAAGDYAALPAGDYACRVLSGELSESKSGTPGYKLTLEVTGGAHAGRRIWHDLWLTAAALPMTKRDLAKLGITAKAQLDQPLPQGILVRVKLTLRKKDDGAEYNRVGSIDRTGTEPPDEYAPRDEELEDAADFPFGASGSQGGDR